MPNVLLGISGGIAAYKACGIASRLVQNGHQVDVLMTEEATRFVAPLSFAAITRRPVWTSLWEEPEGIGHIALVRAADVLLIAPATAHLIARLALGLADDLLTTAALAARIPLVIAPAMNTAMYEHPALQAHINVLRLRGVSVIEPEHGFLAEREYGIGRLAAESTIIEAIEHVVKRGRSLQGRRILITAGPTREAIDPVRFISNAATGATGMACAEEAYQRGAEVRLVLGPTHLNLPAGIEVCRVTTAAQMLDECVHSGWSAPHIIVATAAVADERPLHCAENKLKKNQGGLHHLALTPTADIVARMRERFPEAYILGFAAETENHLAHAHAKLEHKGLDAIIVNDVSGGRGFGATDNTWTLLTRATQYDMHQATKAALAAWLWDTLETVIPSPVATKTTPVKVQQQEK